jgi:hypothetical protein
MLKSKMVRTTVVENYKYNETSGIKLDPTLLLRMLEFAHNDATSVDHLHVIVSKATAHSSEKYMLGMEDYDTLVAFEVPKPNPEPVEQPVLESPTE